MADAPRGTVEDTLRWLVARVERLERRLDRLESALREAGSISIPSEEEEPISPPPSQPSTVEGRIEQELGEFGLGWVGVGVLVVGAILLVGYVLSVAHPLLGIAVGVGSTLAFCTLGRRWSGTLPLLSRPVLVSSYVILFYTATRTHYFTHSPLIRNATAASILIALVVAMQHNLSVRWRSEWLASVALVFLVLAALLVQTPPYAFLLLVIAASVAVGYYERLQWQIAYILGIVLVYVGYLVWLFNNPVLGRPIRAIENHHGIFWYLMLTATILAVPSAVRKPDRDEFIPALTGPILNGLGFFALSVVIAMIFYQDTFGLLFLVQATYFLGISVLLWVRTQRQFAPAFYASFGYMALTIAIAGFTRFPHAFLWLALQSLLVVSMALWFRSRILVVVNTLIYLGILLAYVFRAEPKATISFTYVTVALLSARVMNWQKERLALRTEMLRNLYLAAAFCTMLYGLYHAVPPQFVSLSWTGAAVFYFGMSRLIHNVKYRWMAILTLISAITYLLVVDLARLTGIVRIAAFLVIGITSILTSVFYARVRSQQGQRPVRETDDPQPGPP